MDSATATDPRARWGRTAIAAYFVVGATLDVATHPSSWNAVFAGVGSPLDWLAVVRAGFLFVSSVLFVLGPGAGVIARMWIAYAVVHATTSHAFWAGGPATLVENAAPFLADVAVAATLLLYLSVMERRDPRPLRPQFAAKQ
jgi:uncharacterized membrane protein YphA (DoxX/SURF4 family)